MFETDTALESLAPGPELAGLLATDPAGLAGYDLVSFLGATERLTAWAQSRQHDAIRELARRRPAPVEAGGPGERLPAGRVSEFAANEIAAELRISLSGAQARLALAEPGPAARDPGGVRCRAPGPGQGPGRRRGHRRAR